MTAQTVVVRRDDDLLDAIGPDLVSAGQVAARLRMSVKDAVNLLYDARERGLVTREVTRDDALAQWKVVELATGGVIPSGSIGRLEGKA